MEAKSIGYIGPGHCLETLRCEGRKSICRFAVSKEVVWWCLFSHLAGKTPKVPTDKKPTVLPCKFRSSKMVVILCPEIEKQKFSASFFYSQHNKNKPVHPGNIKKKNRIYQI